MRSDAHAAAGLAALAIGGGLTYGWNGESTYVQNPPYFQSIARDAKPVANAHDNPLNHVMSIFGGKR